MRAAPPLLALVALAGVGACGVRQPAGPPASRAEWNAIVGFEDTLRRLDEDLPRTLDQSGRPDCDRACFLARNICLLAERICTIAKDYPGDREARARCRDAEERCFRARDRVSERCRCM
ncbi:MAG TPA: hypothetical protein VGQ83_19135 [Polyangia bacterium]|jgi:hypothetical protein